VLLGRAKYQGKSSSFGSFGTNTLRSTAKNYQANDSEYCCAGKRFIVERRGWLPFYHRVIMSN
jgi:hypothetical protein